MNPHRPSTNEAFAERRRSAEARKTKELESISRKPRASDKNKSKNRRRIDGILEQQRLKREATEVWEMAE